MYGEVLHLPYFGDGREVGFSFCEEMTQTVVVEGFVEVVEGEVCFLDGEQGAF